MSIQKYQQARELIDGADGGDFEGTKPESLVAKAEAALGLTFPPSYPILFVLLFLDRMSVSALFIGASAP